MGIDPLADDGGQQTLSPYLAMGANPACNVDPLGLQFQGVMSPNSFIQPSLASFAPTLALHMPGGSGGTTSSWQDRLAISGSFVTSQESNTAFWTKVLELAKDAAVGNVNVIFGGNGVSSTATGPDGADASKDGGGTSLFTKGGYKLVVGFNDKERFGIWYKFVGETKEWNDWIDQQDIVDRFLIKVPQHVDNFDGFFGKVSWVLGSSVGRGRYNWDGDFVGLAPMCGTPPVPSFTRIKLASAFGTVSKLWSSTKNLSSAENAFAHFLKHGDDFDEFYNATQYVNGARSFLTNSPVGTLIKTRPNGDILKYLPSTNTFGVMNASGIPRTMFRPTSGMGYWLKQ